MVVNKEGSIGQRMRALSEAQQLRLQQQATLILAQHEAGRKLEPQALTWARNWAFPVRNDKPQGKTS